MDIYRGERIFCHRLCDRKWWSKRRNQKDRRRQQDRVRSHSIRDIADETANKRRKIGRRNGNGNREKWLDGRKGKKLSRDGRGGKKLLREMWRMEEYMEEYEEHLDEDKRKDQKCD